MSTESAAESPDLVSQFAAATKALSEAPPAKEAKPEAAPPGKDEAVGVAVGSGETGQDAGKAEEAPAPATPPDLSWLPEDLRSKGETIDPAVANWMKEHALRQSDYTRKTQALAEERKALEQVKERAALWERLMSHPEAADAAYRAMKGEQAPAKSDEDEVDLFSLDSAGLKKWIEAKASAAVEAARKAAKDEVEAVVVRPQKERSAVIQALIDYAQAESIDDDTMRAAIAAAEAHASEVGVVPTPKNAVALVKPFLADARRSVANKANAAKRSGGLAEVAAPVGRGAGVIPPKAVPSWKSKGADWPETEAEKVAFLRDLAVQNHGLSDDDATGLAALIRRRNGA